MALLSMDKLFRKRKSKSANGNVKKKRTTYKKMAESAYMKDPKNIMKKMAGTGYTIDNALSTPETKLFVDHAKRTVVSSFRGTQIFSKKGVKDIISDIAIATGTERFNRRFKQAERQFEKAEMKYPWLQDKYHRSQSRWSASYLSRLYKREQSCRKHIVQSRNGNRRTIQTKTESNHRHQSQ